MSTGGMLSLTLAEFISALFIAAAAYALFRLGATVQKGFDQLSGRSHEPYVTVSLEPSAAGREYLDLVVENSGFAPAFDIKVTSKPEIPADPESEARPPGWADVSILRPGQSMVSYACPAEMVEDTAFLITVSWKRMPAAEDRYSLEYRLDMRNYSMQEAYPAPQSTRGDLAAELRRIRRDWRALARGDRPFQIELGEDTIRTLAAALNEDERRSEGDRNQEGRESAPRDRSREASRSGRRRDDDSEEPRENAPVSISEVRPRR